MGKEITKEQIADWAEGPTTLALKELIETELRAIQNTSITDCLVVGNPTKSHENLAELEARERVFGSLVEFLEGDWAYFEEEEEEDDERSSTTGY